MRKIAAVDLPFYLPARGPIQGKGGGVFETGDQKEVAERRDGYGEALIAAWN